MARPKGSKNKPKGEKATKTKAKAKAAPAKEQAASSASSAAPQANSGFKKPTAEQVKKLVKAMVSRGNEARTITQGASEMVAKAVENQHFDKKALGIVKGLYQMSINRPESFAITLPHLLAYIDDLGLAETANEARGMDLDGEDEDSGEDEVQTDAAPAKLTSGLRVVPGPNAPESEVPSAPKDEQAA